MNTISTFHTSRRHAGVIARAWQRLRHLLAPAGEPSADRAHHRAIHRMNSWWLRNHLAPQLALYGLNNPQDIYLREARSMASRLNRRLHILFVGTDGAGIGRPLELHASGLAERVTVLVDDDVARRAFVAEAAAFGLADALHVTALPDADACSPMQDLVVVDNWRPGRTTPQALCAAMDQLMARDGMLVWAGDVGCREANWPAIEAQISGQLDALGLVDPRPTRAAARRQERHSAPADVVGALATHFQFELFYTYGGAVLPYVESTLASALVTHQDPESLLLSIERYDRLCLQERMYPPTRMIATLRRAVPAGLCQHTPLSPAEFMGLVAEHAKG
jgi:hypothetical protein